MAPVSAWPRSIVVAGWILIGSGLLHIGIWVFAGGSWAGPVSWRKPILFGLSTGVTLLSLAWVWARVRPRPNDRWLAPLFAVAMLLEVGLITWQQWRGQPSHFNISSPFDAGVEWLMTVLITLATLIITVLTVRTFRTLTAAPDLTRAIHGGMVFLVVSCLTGFAIYFHGKHQASIGADPSLWGTAGVAKFPHGIGIHALQILPAACWVMARAGIPENSRQRLLTCCIACLTSLLAFSLVQTLGGRARFDLTWYSGLILVSAAAWSIPVAIEFARVLGKRFARAL